MQKAWLSTSKIRLYLKERSGQLIDDVYMSSVLPVLAAAAKYGSTIASDGWGDEHRCSIPELVASSKGSLGIFKKLTTNSACAVCARADAQKTARIAPEVANSWVHHHGTCARYLPLPRQWLAGLSNVIFTWPDRNEA